MKRSDVGTTVRRISDGRMLTVIKVIDDDSVEVAWFDDMRKMHKERAQASELQVMSMPLDVPRVRPVL